MPRCEQYSRAPRTTGTPPKRGVGFPNANRRLERPAAARQSDRSLCAHTPADQSDADRVTRAQAGSSDASRRTTLSGRAFGTTGAATRRKEPDRLDRHRAELVLGCLAEGIECIIREHVRRCLAKVERDEHAAAVGARAHS